MTVSLRLSQFVRGVAVASVFAASFAAAPGWAQEVEGPAVLDREAVETIVREYLLENPEVIEQAFFELRRKREVAEAKRVKELLVERRDDLIANPNDAVIGNADGAVTLVEFADYRCGFCRRMEPAVRELLDERPELRMVVKEFPVLGPQSEFAARVALAARDAPQFAELRTELMTEPELDEDAVWASVERVGLDRAEIEEAMAAPEIEEIIRANYELAQSLGVTGTPAYVVGEVLIPGAALEQVVAAVDAEIAKLSE